jgi:hypothetical protein
MDLFLVAFAKSIVLLIWAVISEYFWPEPLLVDDEGDATYYTGSHSPLRLPPPE